MIKTCKNCKLAKSMEEFSKLKNSKDGLQTKCKTCVSSYMKERYINKREDLLAYQQQYRTSSETREKYLNGKKKWYQGAKQRGVITPEVNWKIHLRVKYGITPEQYQAIAELQDFLCANIMCRSDIDPHLDHQHITGLVRGILCGNCNRAFGAARESVDILMGLTLYSDKNEFWDRDLLSLPEVEAIYADSYDTKAYGHDTT